MKRKDDFIDNIFRDGFRNEEQFSIEVPENMFDDFFPEEEAIGQKKRPFYWYRFSAAAALFLSIVGFSWHYLRNLEPVLVKNSPVQTLQQQPSLISQVTRKTPEVKISPKEPKAREPSKLKKEKTAEKQPSRSRSRKKRIGATLFPGIFPAPLFAESNLHPEQTIIENCAGGPPEPEHAALVQEELKADYDHGNEVVAVEFHPEKPPLQEEPIQAIQEPVKKKGLFSFIARARQLDLSTVPSVEEAKGLLVSGIARLVGLNHEEAENQTNENTESEL
jgi:hypothetical protein